MREVKGAPTLDAATSRHRVPRAVCNGSMCMSPDAVARGQTELKWEMRAFVCALYLQLQKRAGPERVRDASDSTRAVLR
jgi:hypothetical protein